MLFGYSWFRYATELTLASPDGSWCRCTFPLACELGSAAAGRVSLSARLLTVPETCTQNHTKTCFPSCFGILLTLEDTELARLVIGLEAHYLSLESLAAFPGCHKVCL